MHILITGATGFIGKDLCKYWLSAGHQITALVRDLSAAKKKLPNVTYITTLDDLDNNETLDAVVNLAGAPIADHLWTDKYRSLLLESRVSTTSNLVALVRRLETKPSVVISASAAGFYGRRGGEVLKEHEPPQPIFMSNLCSRWESAAAPIEEMGVRLVIPRISVVLGADGGALPKLVRPIKFGMGAVTGSGEQYFPWIHKVDLIRFFNHMLTTEALSGPVNAVAPDAVSNAQFNKALTKTLKRPLLIRVPEGILKLILGEMADLFVAGQHMSAKKALSSGFEFKYPNLTSALKNLLR